MNYLKTILIDAEMLWLVFGKDRSFSLADTDKKSAKYVSSSENRASYLKDSKIFYLFVDGINIIGESPLAADI